MDVSVKANVSNLKLSSKFTEEKDKDGVIVDREIVTVLTLEFAGVTPGKFDNIMLAHRSQHEIQADLFTPQMAFNIE